MISKEQEGGCQKRVYDERGFHSSRCSRKAVRDGWCKQHHPDAVKARQEKSEKEYREKWNKSPEMCLQRALKRIGELELKIASLEEQLKARDK